MKKKGNPFAALGVTHQNLTKAVQERLKDVQAANAALRQAQRNLDKFNNNIEKLNSMTSDPDGGAARAKKRKPAKKTVRRRGSVTVGNALMSVLSADYSTSVSQAVKSANAKHGMDIRSTTAHTTMSVLKRKGLIENPGDGWRLVRSSSAGETTDSLGLDDSSASPAVEDSSGSSESEGSSGSSDDRGSSSGFSWS